MYTTKKIVFIVFAIIGFTNVGIAQKLFDKGFEIVQSDWEKKREIGLNMTSLVHSFVPFNLGLPQAGVVGIRSKFYDKNYAFRTCLGSNLFTNDGNTTTKQFFYAALGYERRRIIDKRWTYASGWDFFVGSGVLTDDGSEILIGPTRHYSLEFNLNKRCYINTEAQLLMGIGTQVAFKFIYPTSINFNIRL